MNTITYTKKSLTVFFALVVALSAAVEAGICLGGPEWLYPVLMWLPAVSALAALCVAIAESDAPFSLKSLLSCFRVCHVKYVLLACFLPLCYLLPPYVVYWAMNPAGFAYSGVSLLVAVRECTPVLVLGIFLSLVTALGEEIGWRGFMFPALESRHGLDAALLVSSLVWVVWHFPLILGAGYAEGTPLWYSLLSFALCVFPIGVIAGLLTHKSRSVWPAAFLHAAHNNYDQSVFSVITRGDNSAFFVGETGVLTIMCVWVIAIIMYFSAKKSLKSA